MNEFEIDNYIDDRLNNQIEWYDQKSLHHQRWFKALKSAAITFGILIPITSCF